MEKVVQLMGWRITESMKYKGKVYFRLDCVDDGLEWYEDAGNVGLMEYAISETDTDLHNELEGVYQATKQGYAYGIDVDTENTETFTDGDNNDGDMEIHILNGVEYTIRMDNAKLEDKIFDKNLLRVYTAGYSDADTSAWIVISERKLKPFFHNIV